MRNYPNTAFASVRLWREYFFALRFLSASDFTFSQLFWHSFQFSPVCSHIYFIPDFFFRYTVHFFLFLCSTISSQYFASLQWIHSLAKSVLSITFLKLLGNTSASILRHIFTIPALYVAKPLTFMSSVILTSHVTGAMANWI